MRLKVSESKNAKSLYVIKSVYNPKTKSNTSKNLFNLPFFVVYIAKRRKYNAKTV